MTYFDTIIIGAGAAGLMCAATAGGRRKSVLVLDHTKKIGEKIRISGGGRCNFTNLYASPTNYLSRNPHFCKSALKQYTQHHFIALVDRHGIKWHEKTLGQLFCDESAQQIIDMLLSECESAGVKIHSDTPVLKVEKTKDGYRVQTKDNTYKCQSLVIATGGLSIPKIGASKFGYDIARQFGLNIIQTRAALVPLTFQNEMLERCKALSGIAIDAIVSYNKTDFQEGLLYTHRGLSGPSILQISSYWQDGQQLSINLAPARDVLDFLITRKNEKPKQAVHTALGDILPERLAKNICEELDVSGQLANLNNKTLETIAQRINRWTVQPHGTEGYRTAEVTIGGVDTNELSSKTMECKSHTGLFFIGEVVDVTGHLGGYNFQWAWSSGYVAGMNV